ncbi:MAG TPA: translocation/assembly module TamB domain-containing protein [Longimicrobiales bacterium]
MGRAARIALVVLAALALGLAIAAIAVHVLTETQFGAERVRSFVVGQIEQRIQGEVRIGRIRPGGLLGGAAIEDFRLVGPRGEPFIRADSVRVRYDLGNLLAGRWIFRDVVLYAPAIVLERLPGDTAWNYEYAFADTTPDDDGPAPFILIEDARIVDGTITVRTPWEPRPGEVVEPEDTARLILQPAPRAFGPGTGLVREVRFEDVDAVLPRVLWSSPIEEGRLFQVASLSTRGYLYEDPFVLTGFRGTVTQRDSLVSIDARDLRLPDSRATGVGRFINGDERDLYDLKIEGKEIAFRDLQWLYPDFPDEGGGTARIRIESLQPQGTLWMIEDARIRAPSTEMAGSFGIVTGDTLYFTHVRLRASPLDLQLLSDVLPGDLPLQGLLVGTVEVDGPISALETRGDVRISITVPVRNSSTIRWSGTIGLGQPVALRGVRATVTGLDLALLTAVGLDPGLAGTISLEVTADGRLDRGIEFAGQLRHGIADGPATVLRGEGRLALAPGRRTIDASLEAQPLALEALAAALPSLGRLRGEVRGSLSVSGSLADLRVAGALETSAGPMELDGRFDLENAEPRYTAEGRVMAFRLDKIISGLPETTADASFHLEGQAAGLTAARADLRLDLEAARFDGLPVHGGVLRARLEDGLAHVDTLELATSAGRIAADGAFGLVPERAGTLHLAVTADSLAALDAVLFADSLAFALGGTASARVGGTLRLAADLTGSVHGFQAEGEAELAAARYLGTRAAAAAVRFSGNGIGTDSLRIEATVTADSLGFGERLLSAVAAEATYTALGAGEVRVDARAPGGQTYRAAAHFQRAGGGLEAELREVAIAAHGAGWTLDSLAAIRFDATGLAMTPLVLRRNDGAGRIRMHGRLPWVATGAADGIADGGADTAQADFRVELEGVRLATFLGAAGPAPAADGLLGGWVRVEGPAQAPLMSARLTLAGFRYDEVRLDSIRADLSYAGRRLDVDLRAMSDGRSLFSGSGRIPLDLSLAAVPERRLDEPLHFALYADSVPAALPLSFFDSFRDVRGRMDGMLTLGGTTRAPTLGGGITLREVTALWQPMGVRYRDVEGTFRVVNDSVLAVDVAFRSDPGRATVQGQITFRPLDDPQFDLTVRLDDFLAASRRDVEVTGSGELRVAGRYTRPLVSGSFTIDEGELNLDELWRQYNVVQLGGPLLFEVVDTTRVSVRQILPASAHPFLRNMVVSGTVRVDRDFWLRSQEMNVEVAGELDVAVDRTAEDLRLAGTLDVVRGTYQLYYSPLFWRFLQVREGTVEFVGTPGIDPNLDIRAEYRVRTQNEPLLIQALVTGTLRNPRVTLRSDADPPIAESDLLSYLIFGRPTYALAESEQTAMGAAARQIGLSAIAPTVWGYASSGLEAFARSFGIIDYVSVTAEGVPQGVPTTSTLGNLFAGTQVELGRYIGDNLFVAATQSLPGEDVRQPGFRLEWRFDPTWAAELFYEDRFARQPSVSFDQSPVVRRVFGFFLFREWGY